MHTLKCVYEIYLNVFENSGYVFYIKKKLKLYLMD